MKTMRAAITEPTYHEVVWGCDERDRTVRIDHHDGSLISEDAERLATIVFIKWQGGPVGLFKDGVLIAGTSHSCEQCDPPAEHSTRTYERRVGERYVTKSNGSCGRWRSQYETTWVCTCGNGGFGRDNDRADARGLAKRHREDPEGFPGAPWSKTTVVVTRDSSTGGYVGAALPAPATN